MLGFPFNHGSDFLIPPYDFKYQPLPMTSSILGFELKLGFFLQQWPLLDIHSIKPQMTSIFFHAFKLIPPWRVLHITRLGCKRDLQCCFPYPLAIFSVWWPWEKYFQKIFASMMLVFSQSPLSSQFQLTSIDCPSKAMALLWWIWSLLNHSWFSIPR